MLVVEEDAVWSLYHICHTDGCTKPNLGGGERDCRGAALSDEQMPVKPMNEFSTSLHGKNCYLVGQSHTAPLCSALVNCIVRKVKGGLRQHERVRNMLQVTEIP